MTIQLSTLRGATGAGVHSQEQQHGWVPAQCVFHHSVSSHRHQLPSIYRPTRSHPGEGEGEG